MIFVFSWVSSSVCLWLRFVLVLVMIVIWFVRLIFMGCFVGSVYVVVWE